ncbi:MAG TPA: TonB-dependent receptor [Sphingomonadales bacterium]
MNAISNTRLARKHLLWTTAIVAAVSSLHSTGAHAQGTGSSVATLEEIIVTARQRDESLISTPVAVSAIGAQELQRYSTTDIRDIAQFAPSLSIDRANSGNGGVISLRGISTSSNQAGFDQAVSIAVDGVQTGRARILSQGLFDLQQVEVMKGPQALFFGKNSPAGVIAIRTANPTDELEIYGRASYEFVGDEPIVETAISGPLSDEFGARLAVRYRWLDGYFRNVAGTFTDATYPAAGLTPTPVAGIKRPGEEEIMGRLTLTYTPTGSGFSANLKLSASDTKTDGPAAGTQLYSCGGRNGGVNAVLGQELEDPWGECKFDKYYSDSSLPPEAVANWPIAKEDPYSRAKLYLGVLTLNYEMDNINLTSVTGYFQVRASSFDNYDGTAYNMFLAAENERYNAFSQDFRMLTTYDAPVNFMLGLYYQHTKLDFLNASHIASIGIDPDTGKYHSWEKPGHATGDTYSIFGQAIWDITDQLELAGGVRYTREKKDSTLQHTYVHPPLGGFAVVPVGVVFEDHFRDNNWSPEATLAWRPTSDLTVYGAYKTGYKSGGFGIGGNLVPANLTEDAIRFDSEKVSGFEGGVKAQLLDRRLVVTGDVYSYKYKDLQVTTFNPDTTSFTIENAASSRVKGVEFEGRFSATDNLSLYGSVAYSDSKYLEYIAGCYNTQTAAQGCNVVVDAGADGIEGTADDTLAQSLAGQRRPRAPKWTFTAGFDYVAPLANDWNFGINGHARYSDKYNVTENNNIAGMQDSFWILDAGVRVVSPEDTWQVALVGRNLTNERYAIYLYEKPGAPATANQIAGTPSRGRQVLLEVTFRY